MQQSLIMKLLSLSLFKVSTQPIMKRHQSNLQNDLILIRHAQSAFNKGYLDYLKQNQCDLGWYQCIQIEQFNKKVSYLKDYIDCSLSQEGIKQCMRAKEALKHEEIDIVLVSPYQRTLQTCREIFKDKNVKVEVHPLLAQVLRYSCDVSNPTTNKVKQFSEYDFKFMNHSDFWEIDNQSQRIKQIFNTHTKSLSNPQLAQKKQKLLQLISTKTIYESAQQLRERTWKIKQLLNDYRKKYNKIVVISHFYTIATLIAKDFNENGTVREFEDIMNATPLYKSIQHLLSIK